MKCPRCDNQHADDPKACHLVRAVEYHENGAIKRIDYHGVDGVHTPTLADGSVVAIAEERWIIVDPGSPWRLYKSRHDVEKALSRWDPEYRADARIGRVLVEGGVS